MKKQSFSKLKLRKDIVASLSKEAQTQIAGGGYTQPKCAPIPNSDKPLQCVTYTTNPITYTVQSKGC